MPDNSTHPEAEIAVEAATAAEDVAEQIESVEDRLIDTVTASQQDAMETIDSTRAAVVDMLARARTEISGFVAVRIRQDLETQQELLRCRNFDELRDVQARFVRTAMDQYGSKAAQLVRMGGEVAAKSLERSRP